jgi:predicted dehydrogenase
MAERRRFAQVGLGDRGNIYSEAIVESFPEVCELVGLCDTNQGRLGMRAEWARARGASPGAYLDDQFDQMISECKPDSVIVTTADRYHGMYVCRAMESGCDVIVEKPMTSDEKQCQQILDTQRETGRKCIVTFNLRYGPVYMQIKNLLASGVIGRVLSVDFHELLNTRHGADYFRRWHRKKENSGGLLVHKATHHFDLVNWWLSDIPTSVYAIGRRKFYTRERAALLGLKSPGKTCRSCLESGLCPFYLDLTNHAEYKSLYADNEQFDGYYRDGCVFSDDIDIEDSLHIVVSYEGGATLGYSLEAYSPWEGFYLAFNGSRGRLEVKDMREMDLRDETAGMSDEGELDNYVHREGTRIVVYPHFKKPYAVQAEVHEGSHGGADTRMLADLLCPTPSKDKYIRLSDQRAGAYSVLTGIAGNISIRTGNPVRIDDLVKDIG